MSYKPVYVTRPYLPPLVEFIPYLEDIWESCSLTNGGQFHQQFEKALCEELGVGHVSLVANGTIALIIALRAMQTVGEVITTPYSFVATSHALLWTGSRPVFVDIEPNTLNLDPAKIEAAVTKDTVGILPVHCYGHPCDVVAIQHIADKYNLKVIYDAAHAFGVRNAQGSILRHGDLSVLSFHATKMFTTFEGGAIVCSDARTKELVDQLRNFGIVDDISVATVGINGKMSEFSAALGLLQLKYVGQASAMRMGIDAVYREQLKGIQGIRCLAPFPGDVVSGSYFPIVVEEDCNISRDALYHKLKDKDIHPRRYFYPLISNFPMYRDLPSANSKNLPVATRLANQILCLPIYPAMDMSVVDEIVQCIRDV
ncbi:MAG: DegT/DnrJ/EryC1/StrS family aminotransferase [Magnetococcales bacterium]|nr:DegT/DnrJ/EryC1/StrS family aminotransferase [Magnetococcales bacterium]